MFEDIKANFSELVDPGYLIVDNFPYYQDINALVHERISNIDTCVSESNNREDFIYKMSQFGNEQNFFIPIEEDDLYKNEALTQNVGISFGKGDSSIFPNFSDKHLNGNELLFTIETQPLDHQVKDSLIIPYPSVKIHCRANNSDYIAVFLECDERLNIDPIFLAAHSTKFCNDSIIVFDNLKITNKMLKGRTKGFNFVLRFEYISNSKKIQHMYSNPINIWTHVGQKEFPRDIRDQFQKRWKDSKYTVE